MPRLLAAAARRRALQPRRPPPPPRPPWRARRAGDVGDDDDDTDGGGSTGGDAAPSPATAGAQFQLLDRGVRQTWMWMADRLDRYRATNTAAEDGGVDAPTTTLAERAAEGRPSDERAASKAKVALAWRHAAEALAPDEVCPAATGAADVLEGHSNRARSDEFGSQFRRCVIISSLFLMAVLAVVLLMHDDDLLLGLLRTGGATCNDATTMRATTRRALGTHGRAVWSPHIT
jgi:hypothetical protein